MKLILLSGLDGTGKLFAPFIALLPQNIETQTITYPTDRVLSYEELIILVTKQLPKEEKFILLAESFSGYIAYQIALQRPKNLILLIFVATFLENPRPFLSKFLPIIPMRLILSLPIPRFIAKNFLLRENAMIKLLQKTLKEIPSKILYHRLLEITKLPKATQSIEIKAIYIQATNDKLVSPKAYEVFERLFLGIKRFEVEGSHLILQENSQETARVVEKSLNDYCDKSKPLVFKK